MKWSSSWIGSKKPRKQRAYVRRAPAHVRSTLVASHVSKDLKKTVKTRALRVRKGDKVKIMRGQFKGKTGTVDRVETKRMKVYVSGIEFEKKDGSKALYPLSPSNMLIIEIEGKDKRRVGEKK